MLTNRFLRWLYAIMDHSWGIGRSPRSPVCRNTDISESAALNRGISFPARLRSPINRNIIQQPIGWVGRGDILLGGHNGRSDDPGNVHSGEFTIQYCRSQSFPDLGGDWSPIHFAETLHQSTIIISRPCSRSQSTHRRYQLKIDESVPSTLVHFPTKLKKVW